MSLTKWKKPENGNGQKGESQLQYTPFSNLMDNFFGDNFFPRMQHEYFIPAANISENADQFIVELSAPGFSKEDFKIEIDQDTLIISGEHKSEKESKTDTYTRKEFSKGTFRRSFTLPETVNDESIEANYENGILKLTLPKKEEAKPKPARRINIS